MYKNPNKSEKDDNLLISVVYKIADGVKSNECDDELLDFLVAQKDNVDTVMNIPICDFAIAALHILGKENYTGDDVLIRKIIDGKFDFVK